MSQNKVYVGNLSYDVGSTDLEEHFAKYGEITEAKLITDRDTGRSKGFAFITFADDSAAQAAVDGSNDVELDGRKMRVNLARDDRRSDGGGGGSRGGYRSNAGGNY